MEKCERRRCYEIILWQEDKYFYNCFFLEKKIAPSPKFDNCKEYNTPFSSKNW